jgi:hypothetical protein
MRSPPQGFTGLASTRWLYKEVTGSLMLNKAINLLHCGTTLGYIISPFTLVSLLLYSVPLFISLGDADFSVHLDES